MDGKVHIHTCPKESRLVPDVVVSLCDKVSEEGCRFLRWTTSMIAYFPFTSTEFYLHFKPCKCGVCDRMLALDHRHRSCCKDRCRCVGVHLNCRLMFGLFFRFTLLQWKNVKMLTSSAALGTCISGAPEGLPTPNQPRSPHSFHLRVPANPNMS